MPCTALHAVLLATSLATASLRAQDGVQNTGQPASRADSATRLAAELMAGRVVVGGISFAAGSATIDRSSAGALRALADALHHTTGTFLIESHTSPRSGAQGLSDRRAAAVRTWLLAAGVDPRRLYAAGFGATRPRPPPNRGRSDRIEISRVS